jgi:hypothetical protein
MPLRHASGDAAWDATDGDATDGDAGHGNAARHAVCVFILLRGASCTAHPLSGPPDSHCAVRLIYFADRRPMGMGMPPGMGPPGMGMPPGMMPPGESFPRMRTHDHSDTFASSKCRGFACATAIVARWRGWALQGGLHTWMMGG